MRERWLFPPPFLAPPPQRLALHEDITDKLSFIPRFWGEEKDGGEGGEEEEEREKKNKKENKKKEIKKENKKEDHFVHPPSVCLHAQSKRFREME